jgi:triosephosphate isomerase (TIM)
MTEEKFIALNLKTYELSDGFRGLELCKIANAVAAEKQARIITCPNITLLREAKKFHGDLFAQHVDGNSPGAFTGSVTAKMLLDAGAKGSLINHSEKRLNPENIKVAVDTLRKEGLESMLCAKDVQECTRLAQFKPDYLAIEPPELIGSGISVSSAKPEIVTGAISAIKEVDEEIKVVCGAGVSSSEDVKKAFELGVVGVLLASAYVKSDDPKKLLEEMVQALKSSA